MILTNCWQSWTTTVKRTQFFYQVEFQGTKGYKRDVCKKNDMDKIKWLTLLVYNSMAAAMGCLDVF